MGCGLRSSRPFQTGVFDQLRRLPRQSASPQAAPRLSSRRAVGGTGGAQGAQGAHGPQQSSSNSRCFDCFLCGRTTRPVATAEAMLSRCRSKRATVSTATNGVSASCNSCANQRRLLDIHRISEAACTCLHYLTFDKIGHTLTHIVTSHAFGPQRLDRGQRAPLASSAKFGKSMPERTKLTERCELT